MDMNRLKRSGIVIIAGCAVFGALLNADAKTGIINT
jgi:hypothetical protein